MTLQALEYGIYSTWISLFDVDEASKILGLPTLYIPSEIIAFGYPQREESGREKNKMEDIVFYDRYMT